MKMGSSTDGDKCSLCLLAKFLHSIKIINSIKLFPFSFKVTLSRNFKLKSKSTLLKYSRCWTWQGKKKKKALKLKALKLAPKA